MAISGFLVSLTLAFFSYFLARTLKLPELALLILIASLVGPHGFSLVSLEEVEVFSSIGVMFLLYIIGLEFKTSHLIYYGTRGFVFAILKMTMVALPIIYFSMVFFDFTLFEAFLIGLGLSITSTAIFSKISKSLGIFRRRETKQLFAELIWEDIFAVFFLILITSYVKTGNVETSFILGLAYFTVPYFIVRKISEAIVHHLPRDLDVYFLFSMAIAGVLVVISSVMGVPVELAAFLAGSIAANFKEVERIKKNLNVLGSTFIIFFFFSLGMEANLSVFLDFNLILFMIFVLLVNALFKVFSTSLISLSFGSTPRIAALSGLLMMSVGEFSLLLAKETSPLFLNFDVFSLISGIVFLSSLISWYFPSLYTMYADLLSRLSKDFSLIKKTKNKTFFYFSYEFTKIEKGEGLSFLVKAFNAIEVNIILVIIFLLFSTYITIWFPDNPYSIPLSYASLFISLILIILSLITLKVKKYI